jgi:hypothetical protein
MNDNNKTKKLTINKGEDDPNSPCYNMHIEESWRGYD